MGMFFASCKQETKNELKLEEKTSDFIVRFASIKAKSENVFTSIPLKKLQTGTFEFVSIDPTLQLKLVTSSKIAKGDATSASLGFEDDSKKIAIFELSSLSENFQEFTFNIQSENGKALSFTLKAKTEKTSIQGLKVKINGELCNIEEEIFSNNENAEIEITSTDSIIGIKLIEKATNKNIDLSFQKNKTIKGKIEELTESYKEFALSIEAENRLPYKRSLFISKNEKLAIDTVILRPTEWLNKSPYNLNMQDFTFANGVYESKTELNFDDWQGEEVAIIIKTKNDPTQIGFAFSANDKAPTSFEAMPKRFIYTRWNNSGGVAPENYLDLKDVHNIKNAIPHGKNNLFIKHEKGEKNLIYKIKLNREKENEDLCEFIHLSTRRIPLVDYYDVEEKQPSLSYCGIHDILYIFKTKNPRGSLKFYVFDRDGRREIKAEKIPRGEYKGHWKVVINPLSQNSESYCEAFAVAENGRIAKSKTEDPNGLFYLSLNNIFLSFSYKDEKDSYTNTQKPNRISFEKNKLVAGKLFIRVILPTIYKNDLILSEITPPPMATDLPSNMSKYSAYFVAYKLEVDAGSLQAGKTIDMSLPIKNTETNNTVFTHLITIEEAK